MSEIKNINESEIEIENNPAEVDTSGTGERDSLGRKKRRWGYNREQRASLRKMAAEIGHDRFLFENVAAYPWEQSQDHNEALFTVD